VSPFWWGVEAALGVSCALLGLWLFPFVLLALIQVAAWSFRAIAWSARFLGSTVAGAAKGLSLPVVPAEIDRAFDPATQKALVASFAVLVVAFLAGLFYGATHR